MSPRPAPQLTCLTCTSSRRRKHLMCPGCWSLVPDDIQAEVYQTWNRGSIRQPPEWSAAVAAAEAAVLAAREGAS